MLKKFNLGHYINYIVIGIITIVLAVITFSGGRIDSSTLFLLEKIAISIILAVSLSLVVGFLGELSLGHAGFMCVGAYIGGKVAALLEPTLGNGVLTFVIALLVGGGIAAICGIIISIPALRLRGDYLAIVTLAFGEIVKSLFQNTSDETFGGALGLDTPRFDKKYLLLSHSCSCLSRLPLCKTSSAQSMAEPLLLSAITKLPPEQAVST